MNSQGFSLKDQRGSSLAELLVSTAVLGLVMAAVLVVYTTGAKVGIAGENRAEAQQAARAAALMNEDLRLAGYGYPPSGSTITPPAGPTITAAVITAASPTAVSFMADVMNVSTTLSVAANPGNASLSVNSTAGFAAGDTIFLINGGQSATFTVQSVAAGNTINVTTGVICPGNPPIAPPCYPIGSQVGRPRVITYSWSAVTQTLSKNAGDGTGAQPLATGIPNLQLTYFDASDTVIPPANFPASLPNIRRIAIALTAQSVATQNRGTFTINSAVRPRNL